MAHAAGASVGHWVQARVSGSTEDRRDPQRGQVTAELLWRDVDRSIIARGSESLSLCTLTRVSIASPNSRG